MSGTNEAIVQELSIDGAIQPWAGYITGVCLNVSGGMEFGTIPKYYAFDASEEKMKNAVDV